MKKFVIFVSALTLFLQAHAQIPISDGAVINKDLTSIADELRRDAKNDRFAGVVISIAGAAIVIATQPLAVCIKEYYTSPNAEKATLFAGLFISLIAGLLENFYFEKIALKKELQAQKILDSVKKIN